jgi:hypothetical protein
MTGGRRTTEGTVAVTGATSGIGRAVATRPAQASHRLILTGRDPDKARTLKEELPQSTTIVADISTRHGVPLVERLTPLLLAGSASSTSARRGTGLRMVRTELGRELPRARVAAMHAISTSARTAALAIVRLATSPDVHAGYYDRERPARPSSAALNRATAARLWDITGQLTDP